MFLAYLVAASTAAAPANNIHVTPADPAAIVLLLQREGYKAKLDKDKTGDPMIVSAASGAEFQILFYDCKEGRECGSLQFHAGFTMAKDKKLSPDKINEYNREWRFGRAYLDEERDPILKLDLAFGGSPMPEAMFLENLDDWAISLGQLQRHVGW